MPYGGSVKNTAPDEWTTRSLGLFSRLPFQRDGDGLHASVRALPRHAPPAMLASHEAPIAVERQAVGVSAGAEISLRRAAVGRVLDDAVGGYVAEKQPALGAPNGALRELQAAQQLRRDGVGNKVCERGHLDVSFRLWGMFVSPQKNGAVGGERQVLGMARSLRKVKSPGKSALARVTLILAFSHQGLTGVGLRPISPTPEPRLRAAHPHPSLLP